MTWNTAQFEVLYPAALLCLALVPLVVYLSCASLLQFVGWQQKLGLVVRCSVLILLAFALCGIQWITTTEEKFVVFVVDESRSITKDGRSTANQFIEQATASISVEQWSKLNYGSGELGDSLAREIESASAAIPSGYVPRIVLLSDGNAPAEPTILAARSLGVPIDTVALPSQSESEAYLRDLLAPASVPAGLPFDIEVVIQATHEGQGVVTLKQGADTDERKITVQPGENRVRFRRWLTSENAAVLTATISNFADTIAENNTRSVVVVPQGRARVLILESASGSTTRFKQLMEGIGAQVEQVSPPQLPVKRTTLGRYDLVVLSNVAPNLLTDEQQSALEEFVQTGGGLLIIGGDQAFRRQALANSTLERILPIKSLEAARATQASLAMVLVIDRSKSMEPAAGRTADKMALAKQAANLAVDILQPSDKVGVITFSDNTQWVSDLAPVDEKQQLKKHINSIVAEGGTNMYAALDKAYLALRRADAKIKHVIVLTDGISVPGDFEAIATQMAEAGITVSTVAIGKGVAEAVLTDISRAGHGRHYVCEDPGNLPEIVAGETRSASETVASEQTFRSQMIHVPPRLSALELDKAPPLGGYAETTPKRDAQLVLTSETGDPLLAWWRYGSGTVVAFTSDAELRWAKKWTEWSGYDHFWRELAHQAMRPARNSQMTMQVVSQGEVAYIIVDVTNKDGESENGKVLEIQDDMNGVIRLRQTMPGRYQAEIAADEKMSLKKLSISGVDGKTFDHPLGIIGNYPEELKLRSTNTALLNEISKQSGGRFEVSPDAVFEEDGRTAFRVVPLWSYFTVLALVAFLLDVTLRRVDFNRWVGKHTN